MDVMLGTLCTPMSPIIQVSMAVCSWAHGLVKGLLRAVAWKVRVKVFAERQAPNLCHDGSLILDTTMISTLQVKHQSQQRKAGEV